MPLYDDDEERYETLKNAITSTYAAGPAHGRRRRRKPLYASSLTWFLLGGCLVVLFFAGVMVREWRAAMQFHDVTQEDGSTRLAETTAPPVTLPPYTPAPHTPPPYTPPPHTPPPDTPPPHTPPPTAAPTAPPTGSPTGTPSPSATAPASTAASPSPQARAGAVIHNAFLLVHSNDVLKVGAKGSCGGLDVTVEVRGYPKGCTVFDADSTGPLANGRGTVLVVPVSSTEDVGDVKYGLLYFRSNLTDAPRFLGLIRGHGPGPVVVRLERGVIVEQTGDDRRYFTFDGSHIVRVVPRESQPG